MCIIEVLGIKKCCINRQQQDTICWYVVENVTGQLFWGKIVFKTASDRDLKYLKDFEKDLPAVFIVSQVAVVEVKAVQNALSENFSKTEVQIERAEGEKCQRCWNYRILGFDPDHPSLCDRCASVVKEFIKV